MAKLCRGFGPHSSFMPLDLWVPLSAGPDLDNPAGRLESPSTPPFESQDIARRHGLSEAGHLAQLWTVSWNVQLGFCRQRGPQRAL